VKYYLVDFGIMSRKAISRRQVCLQGGSVFIISVDRVNDVLDPNTQLLAWRYFGALVIRVATKVPISMDLNSERILTTPTPQKEQSIRSFRHVSGARPPPYLTHRNKVKLILRRGCHPVIN